MTIKKDKLKVSDMTCISCEKRIENEVRKLNGVANVITSNKEASVIVEYDTALCSDAEIKSTIERAGYTVGGNSQVLKLIGILFIGLAIYLLGNFQSSFDMSSKLQTGTTLFVLFIVGVFTSIHCVGMCGGIMLSQSISKDSSSKWNALKPTFLYNAGRVVSYTIIGGIVGAIGSVLSISLQMKAGISIFAGIFMIIMGFNMAGFGLFKRFNLRMPWSFCKIKNKSRTPFIVGLLNGLLPCGPLQTMQLYALGTGSFVIGALSMFLFSIGTVPLMLTFGLLTGFLSKGFTKSLLKFSGILVLILGFVMANRGFILAGARPITIGSIMSYASPKSSTSNSSTTAFTQSSKAVLKDGVQILKMEAGASGYTPNVLFVQKGVPVKWIINGTQITSCNGQIVIPSMNKQLDLKPGENVIEFTPTGTDDITFSCWMGMLNGVIKVVDNLKTFDAGKTDIELPTSNSMGCCSIGGGDSASASAQTPTTAPSNSSTLDKPSN
jgi:sulfite exporter TauE/SafE/copper chaperone CopZ